jgi:hypothetical protein
MKARNHIVLVQGVFFICLASMSCKTIKQAKTTDNEIVQYTIQKPDVIEVSKEFQINVVFSVQQDWYLYAPTGNNAAQGMIETKVIFAPPVGITRIGKIKLPDPVFKNGHEVYKGENIVMSQVFQTAPDLKPGKYEIKGKITYQTCNNDICLPPVTEDISEIINMK